MALVDSAELGQHGIVVVRHCLELPKLTVSMMLPGPGESVLENSRWRELSPTCGRSISAETGGGAQRFTNGVVDGCMYGKRFHIDSRQL